MNRPEIEARRTVHGGEDSALSVQVCAWRRADGGIDSTVEETAHGFGVYIKNPLAMHLQDFTPGWGEDQCGNLAQAKMAALEWADALGDHLGAPVYLWGVTRPAGDPVPVPAAPPVDPGHLAEIAATLWEAALDLKERGEPKPGPLDVLANRFFRRWEERGTSDIRAWVAGMAADCDAAWHALTDEERDELAPFDWQFAPDWLRDRLESSL